MESAFMQNIVNRFLCLELNFRRNVIVWFDEHRNLKNLSNRVITKVIIQLDSKNQLMLKNSLKFFFMREDILFKHG